MVRRLFNYKIVKILSVIILVLIPIILFIFPANYFDNGESVCLSVFFFDQECYACGMTRAVMHFIHLEFNEAYNYNPLVIFVFPILFLIWLKMLLFFFNIKILKWL